MKQKIMICLVAVAAFFTHTRTLAQGWERTFAPKTNAYSIVEAHDGGFVFAGKKPRDGRVVPDSLIAGYALYVVKTDKRGDTLWSYSANNIAILVEAMKIIRTPDDGFLIFCSDDIRQKLGLPSVFVVKLDKNGSEKWRKTCSSDFFQSAALSLDSSQIIISTRKLDTIQPFFRGYSLIKMTINGDTLWSKFYPFILIDNVVFGGDGQIYTTYRDVRLLADYHDVAKFDSIGNRIWNRKRSGTQTSPYQPMGLKRAKDGRILVGSGWKLDYDGTTIWGNTINNNLQSERFDEYKNGKNIAVVMNTVDPTGTDTDVIFAKKDSVGTEINRRYIKPSIEYINDFIATSDNGFIAVGQSIFPSSRICLTKFNSEGVIYSNTLKGKIIIDSIQNCRLDASETGFPNRLVSVEKGNDIRWAKINGLGNYEMQVDTGNYLIRSVLPNQNWRFCTPSVSKQISAFSTTDTVNFALQALVNCPQMRISTATQGLRRCFDNNYYYIRYTNEGTQAAQNAFITLKLDSLLEYVGATRRLSSRVGQMLTFNLGTVPIGFDDQFSVQVRVKCGDSTRLGQSLCTEARIFPDTVCIPAPNWSGANIVVSGRCDRDSVRFLVQNIGTGASSSLRRQIVEDEIVFLNGTINVPASTSRTISVPANGKTWRLNVDQEPNNPLSNQPTAVVEGCRTSPNKVISTGFVNQFPTDDGSPTVDNVCAQIVGAYDPNDKEGLPLGYKNQRFINQNQAIDYRIRFQNTGNDTAFTVVLRDTLSDFLDISSLKVGASSHKYTWSIEGKNVLVFRFDDIKLVDSFRNVAVSQGFVAFKINQKKDVALGSIINNEADIYFDYNAPIRTNKTVHTIGKDFIVSVLQINSNVKNVQINVFPNPFSAQTTLELQGFEKTGPLSILSDFTLFDAFGRQLRHEKFDGNQFVFERQNLGTGIYFFKIEQGGKLIGTGKFLIQ